MNTEHSNENASVVQEEMAPVTGSGPSWRKTVVLIVILLIVFALLFVAQINAYNARESQLLDDKSTLVTEKKVLEERLETLRHDGEAREEELIDVAAVVAMMVTKEKTSLIEEKRVLEEQLKSSHQTDQAHEQELTNMATVAAKTLLEQRAGLVEQRARIETREQELTDVAAAVAVTLTREKANLKNRVQELEEQQSSLKKQLENLRVERKELVGFVTELSEVKGQIDTLLARFKALQVQ